MADRSHRSSLPCSSRSWQDHIAAVGIVTPPLPLVCRSEKDAGPTVVTGRHDILQSGRAQGCSRGLPELVDRLLLRLTVIVVHNLPGLPSQLVDTQRIGIADNGICQADGHRS